MLGPQPRGRGPHRQFWQMVSSNYRCLVLCAVLVLSGCSSMVPVPTMDTTPSASAAQAAWSRVLATYVNAQGQVDFCALARAPADLETYVAWLANTDAGSWSDRSARLAHYINSYNALSMFGVISAGLPETHAGLRKIRFFYWKTFTVGGRQLSLYSYENDIIRPLGEPRVHFALNCSAVSCPTLPDTAFTAQAVDQELDNEARKFINDTRHVHLDAQEQVLYLSEIFKFYREDFVPTHSPSLTAYVNRYRDTPVPLAYRVRFIPYDWTITAAPR